VLDLLQAEALRATAISSMTLEKLPRRIARWVMIPNQRSTLLNQEA